MVPPGGPRLGVLACLQTAPAAAAEHFSRWMYLGRAAERMCKVLPSGNVAVAFPRKGSWAWLPLGELQSKGDEVLVKILPPWEAWIWLSFVHFSVAKVLFVAFPSKLSVRLASGELGRRG